MSKTDRDMLQQELLQDNNEQTDNQMVHSKRYAERVLRKENLDMSNEEYVRLKWSWSVPNMVRSNIDWVTKWSDENTWFKWADKSQVDVSAFLDPDGPVYLYSGQKFASAELQKQYMRSKMWNLQEG